MRLRSTRLLAAVAASLLMALATAGASARSISVNEQAFRMSWSGFEFVSATADVGCDVTLSGSFHSRTWTKTAGLLIGTVSGATLNEITCLGGSATILRETLPWHVRYASFEGFLPRISGIRVHIVNLSMQVNQSGVTCLARTDAAEPAVGDFDIAATSGESLFFTFDPNAQIDLDSPGFLCDLAGDASLFGVGGVVTPSLGTVVFRLMT